MSVGPGHCRNCGLVWDIAVADEPCPMCANDAPEDFCPPGKAITLFGGRRSHPPKARSRREWSCGSWFGGRGIWYREKSVGQP
jgi:hypothetical protein